MLDPRNYAAPGALLAGKVILVTGAGDGIGRAAALSFARHGATVLLLGRTEAKLESVYDDIERMGWPQPAILPVDLLSLDEAQSERLATTLADNFGRLDGLLHNAALLGERRPIEDAGYTSWQEVMQVNVNAQFLLTRALLPVLRSADSASIVFTSSSVGRKGKAYWGSYAVSKFATEGFMQVLADELENTSRIRVNSLNPGATNTRMRRTAYPGETPGDNRAPEDIMNAYLFLMGDDSIGITGQALSAQ